MPEIPTILSPEISEKYIVENNTFLATPKSDWKDRIEVEIGDSKQEDFLPQVKIQRWDNEVNFSARLIHDEVAPVVSTESDKIVWDGDKIAAHFYDIDGEKKERSANSEIRVIRDTDFDYKMASFPELHGHTEIDKPILYSKKFTDTVVLFSGFLPLSEWSSVEDTINDYDKIRFLRFSRELVGGIILNEGTIWQSIIYPEDERQRYNDEMIRGVLSVTQSYGIDTFSKDGSNDIYFRKDGKEKKFCGIMQTFAFNGWESMMWVITLDFPIEDARKIYNLSSQKFTKKGEVIDISDVAGGLREVVQTINTENIESDLIREISNNLGLSGTESSFTEDEEGIFTELDSVHISSDWTNNANRDDIIDLSEKVIKTAHEEGASEFEIILKEKPTTNVVQFTLETKGLDFFYQPELTQEELNNGYYRPTNVIGSYAVYASEEKINYEGGKEYKAGKVGHIYRPRIEDANGDWVWGSLKIEEGLLSVEIPQDFLDKAVYPVRHAAGLTFGYTTQGSAGSISITRRICGSMFTGAAGVADSIGAWITTVGTPQSISFGLYDTSFNLITNSQTPTEVPPSTGAQQFEISYTSPPTITAQDYWIVGFSDGDSKNKIYIYYDALVSGCAQCVVDSFGALPDPMTPGTYYDFKLSIWCTYTAAGSSSISTSTSPSASKSVSPSVSPSGSVSQSVSPSVSPSGSVSQSVSPSISPSGSISQSVSPSISPSGSISQSISRSASSSLSPSISPSKSPSKSPSRSPSVSSSRSSSRSPSASRSGSPSVSPSRSPSISPSGSVSQSISPSQSPSASPSASVSTSPSASSSLSPSVSPSASSSASPSASQSVSPSISPSISESASPSLSPSISPSTSPSPSEGSSSRSPSLSPSESPSASVSQSPSTSPSASVSASPSLSPSVSPSISPSGSISQSISPSGSPSVSPSVSRSGSPSISPSASRSASPSISPSASVSVSPSVSPSISPSGSVSQSISPSISPSRSPSASSSVSPSFSPSASRSASPSVSPSASVSASPSISPSISPSGSVSQSTSPSVSPSVSPSASSSRSPSLSPSVSRSASPSLSPSVSVSGSPSVSPSISPSGSISQSISPSGSPSVSPSQSPSASISVSPSFSPSASVSASPSASPSVSPSTSPSISPSGSVSSSVSPSVSPSPSSGWEFYTRGDYADLPADNTNLENNYSSQDYIDVNDKNDVRVGQTATSQYAIHQFKDYATTNSGTLEWEGQTNLAPSASSVLLQIYNQSTGWETVDFDNSSAANTDFTLTAYVGDLTNYKDGSSVVSCRVYQQGI